MLLLLQSFVKWWRIHLSTKNFTDSLFTALLQDNVANPKEKTPMCLVNELARFNRIQPQYKLLNERGPAHAKVRSQFQVMSHTLNADAIVVTTATFPMCRVSHWAWFCFQKVCLYRCWNPVDHFVPSFGCHLWVCICQFLERPSEGLPRVSPPFLNHCGSFLLCLF